MKLDLAEAATEGVLCENVFLEISQNSQENTCASAFFVKNFIKKETLLQVFFCEFFEISKKFFTEESFTWYLWINSTVLLNQLFF